MILGPDQTIGGFTRGGQTQIFFHCCERYQSNKRGIACPKFLCSCSNFNLSAPTEGCYDFPSFDTAAQHSKKLTFSIRCHSIEDSASPEVQPRKPDISAGGVCLQESTDWSSECAAQYSTPIRFRKFHSYEHAAYM